MLEQKVKVISEVLARATSRRTFLGRAGTAVASGVATLALGNLLAASPARASTRGPIVPNITCSPPGPYCNTGAGSLSGCHGSQCYQHLSSGQIRMCHVYYQFYPGGCWTSSDGWTCCDCQCDGGATCGCAQQHASPVALPE